MSSEKGMTPNVDLRIMKFADVLKDCIRVIFTRGPDDEKLQKFQNWIDRMLAEETEELRNKFGGVLENYRLEGRKRQTEQEVYDYKPLGIVAVEALNTMDVLNSRKGKASSELRSLKAQNTQLRRERTNLLSRLKPNPKSGVHLDTSMSKYLEELLEEKGMRALNLLLSAVSRQISSKCRIACFAISSCRQSPHFDHSVLCCVKLHCGSPTLLSTASSAEKKPRTRMEVETKESVNASELRSSLISQNVGFSEGYACYQLPCPVCSPPKPQRDALMNKTTGKWLCLTCRSTGNWRDFQHLSRLPKQEIRQRKIKALATCTMTDQQLVKELAGKPSLSEIDSTKLKLIKKTFKLNQLSVETLNRLGCVSEGSSKLLFPVRDMRGALVAIQTFVPDATCGLKMEKVVPSGSMIPVGACESAHFGGTAVITSNMLDALVISDQTDVPAIALPCGMHRLPQETLFWLENWEKLVMWFGTDQQSWLAVRALAKKLGESRCFYVNPAQWSWGPHKALSNKGNIARIVDEARPVSHKDIATFPYLREHVKSELALVDQVRGVKWKRFKGLNSILRGHRRGELTIITGQTGTGKTTFMSEYSLDLCMSGVSTLWGSFEIQPVRLAKVMLMQYAGLDLEAHLAEFDKWADKFEKLPLYFTILHGETGLSKVLDAMTHAVYINDIHHVVLDNLQFMIGLGGGSGFDRFAKQDQAIASFRKFATVNNCHVSLVIHPRKEGFADDDQLTVASIFGGAKASQEADNVLILQDRSLKAGMVRKKYLQVAKNRFSGDTGILPLEFNKASRSFAGQTQSASTSAPNKLIVQKKKVSSPVEE
ncbi:unnamed protein product [Notodromas monacha]|uniref:DNA 5'-3' helicase n=1 Tax=Notodromas monacha TaxID=399045 RepID=A0A7R9G9X3_9CRUS|nr:unnamed protein product [Notodromas monacha]CAG0913518.1 unnamed protein product [Notodromas monacha]